MPEVGREEPSHQLFYGHFHNHPPTPATNMAVDLTARSITVFCETVTGEPNIA